MHQACPSPEVLQVLHPLKEADCYTTTICVDVGQHRDATIAQDLVTLHVSAISNMNTLHPEPKLFSFFGLASHTYKFLLLFLVQK